MQSESCQEGGLLGFQEGLMEAKSEHVGNLPPTARHGGGAVMGWA